METRLLDVAKNLGRTLGGNFYSDPDIVEEFQKVKDQNTFFNTLITGMFKLYRNSLNGSGKKDLIPIKEETVSYLLEKIDGEKQFHIFKDIVIAFMLTAALEKSSRYNEPKIINKSINAIG